MGERGSAHKPSVIQIFAYPGYKEAYMGGFALACVDRLFFLTAASCVDLTFFFFCRALDFGS